MVGIATPYERWWGRVSGPVQTGPEARPASYTTGTGSLFQEQSGRGVALTIHPFLAPGSSVCLALPYSLILLFVFTHTATLTLQLRTFSFYPTTSSLPVLFPHSLRFTDFISPLKSDSKRVFPHTFYLCYICTVQISTFL